MNILFDKTQPRLVMNGFPLGTTNYKLKVNEYVSEGTVNGEVEIGNFGLALTATLQAIKVEQVPTEVVAKDYRGEDIIIDGIPQYETIMIPTETVLESKIVDLKVL